MSEQANPEVHARESLENRHSLIVPKQPGPKGEADQQGPTHARNSTAAAAIAQTLAHLGAKRVFGVPGGPISPVIDALLDTEIEHVTCQHENMAVYAAGAEGLVRRKPGIVAVTSGPGILNALTGAAACFQDQMPVVLLVGEVATANQGRGALQDGSESALDIGNMVRSICKKSMLIEQPERAGEDIAEAWRIANKAPFGPVVVRIPVDIATNQVVCGPSRGQRVAARRRTTSPEKLASVARALREAKRPVLLIGGGVCRAQAYTAVRQLAEATRCAVMTDLEAKGAFPESHPLSLGIFGVGGDGRASRYLEDTDVVITLGARLDDTTTANFSPLLQPANGCLIQVDDNPMRLGRSYRPTLTVTADLKSFCNELSDTVGEVHRPYPDVPPKQRASTAIAQAPHDPVAVIAALQQKLPADTVFVSDIGNHLLFAAQALTLEQPGCFHASLGLGGMGSGIGVAIGMQAAYGDQRQVVCICGDGSYLMSGNEIATCARYGIPVIFLVINDGQLGMVQHGAQRVYNRSHEWSSPELDVRAHASALGIINGELTNIEGVLDDRLRPGPVVFDVPISPHTKAFNPRDATLFTSEEKAPTPATTSVQIKSPQLIERREVA